MKGEEIGKEGKRGNIKERVEIYGPVNVRRESGDIWTSERKKRVRVKRANTEY